MSYSSTTTNLHLPQFADSDIPTWNDINTAMQLIDEFAGTVQPTDLTGFVKYTSAGAGITNAQYSHLEIVQ